MAVQLTVNLTATLKESCNLLLSKLLSGTFSKEQEAQKHALAGSENQEEAQQ